MKMYGEKYYVGLDMGTNSVGWALTDEHYNLRRVKGKDAWGARLFDEANSSVERRGHRTARRRRQREKARIGLLKDYFAEEINKVDPGFYLRLEESKYHKEDRSQDNQQKFSLFTGEYTDKDYYTEYPTVFHLRKALIKNENAPYDVRLVFLGLLNMYKHRGNFLNSSLDTETEASDMISAWNEFVSTAEAFSIVFSHDDAEKIEEFLSEKGISKSQVAQKIIAHLGFDKKDKAECGLVELFSGKTVKLINIYGPEVIDNEHKAFSICFRDSNYDEKEQEVREYLGEEYFELIEAAKVVHDLGLLANIMKGQEYLTYARVEAYEAHKRDLAQLKKLLMKYDMNAYNMFFRKMEEGNYSAYVGSVYSHDKRVRRNEGKGRKQEDLYKTLKKILGNLPQEDTEVQDILNKIEAETFLPKQLIAANGVIPNQVYVREMKKILENAEKYLVFLKNKDESGLTVSERILELFTFRIPYYVGPIGRGHEDREGYNVWAVRKEQGRVYPWNFEEKIDTKRSAEKFIERMVRKCTYISEERTLPKNSLLYEKYMVLNELNNLKVNGEKISVSEKQEIYNTLFLTGKKVSIKQLEKFFVIRGKVSADAQDFLSGIDVEGGFKASLSSLGKFYGVFGDDIKKDEFCTIAENIIFWMTIYGNDKKFVKERMEEEYAGKITSAQMKRILGFKFSDWGNLSKEFLELQEEGATDGLSLIQALWETNENLMELLSTEHGYRSALESKSKKAEKALAEWTIEDIDELYVSAPVKRMIWQTIKIMNELTEITGHEPERIFVEMPREEGEKQRTVSRKKKLSELYARIKGEEREWKKEIDAKQEADFRSKKLYLYYLQMGRCMYSGEVIDLHTLLTDNTAYDIDHIYPRHFIKDDSIENNLVLVKKQINNEKSDQYPLNESIRSSRHAFWNQLKKKGFITAEKYNRLTRVAPFTDEEKAAFISRQLVETRQGTKVITEILQSAFPNSTIVFSKAREVSDFRKKYDDMVKVRCVNDLHHAKDAYLNIVVGNTYYVKFTANPLHFIKEAAKHGQDSLYKYHMDHIFDYDVKRGEELAWNGTGKDYSATFDTVKRTMARNTVLITKRPYVACSGITGKDTVYSAMSALKNPGAYLPMTRDARMADVTKYGGRTSISTQCYCLVSYKVKGKAVLSIEALPVYIGDIRMLSDDKVLEYLRAALQAENGNKEVTEITLKYKCIRFNSLIKVDGHLYHIGGKTGAMIYLKNAEPFIPEKRWEIYIKKVETALNREYYDACEDGEKVLSTELNMALYSYIKEKMEKVYGMKKSSILNIVQDGEEQFGKISMKDQCYTIMQIVTWLGLNCLTVDLTKIGGKEKAGFCRLGKKIGSCLEVKLINQSCTGLRTTSVDLLSL